MSYGSTRGRRRIFSEERFNIIVRYLPLDLLENDLYDLFSPMGPIISVKLMRTHMGSEGYGFVNFAHREDAERAIKQFNNYRINPRKTLKVHWSAPGRRTGCKIFVTFMPLHWTQEDFAAAFQVFGETEEVRLLDIRNNRLSGFVLYFRSADAQTAIRSMNGFVPPYAISALQVELARRSEYQIETKALQRQKHFAQPYKDVSTSPKYGCKAGRLFFYNAPVDLDQTIVRPLFANYGQVMSVNIQKDSHDQFLGMGFVQFQDPQSALSCIKRLNGAVIWGRKIQVCSAD